MKRNYSKDETFKCEVCMKTFYYSGNLDKHLKAAFIARQERYHVYADAENEHEIDDDRDGDTYDVHPSCANGKRAFHKTKTTRPKKTKKARTSSLMLVIIRTWIPHPREGFEVPITHSEECNI